MKAQWVGLIVIFLVASWRMAWPAFAAAADAGIPVLALDKPEALGKLSPKNAQIEWLRPGAMRVAFALADWPNVFFAAGKAYERQDWREFGALALEMANPGDETVDVYVRVDDDAKADGLNHCRTGRAKIGPKERVTLVLEFESSTPGMRGAPPLPVLANARRMEYHGKPLDMSHIVAFQVFLPKPKAPRTLELANP
ncbi:MAG: hypothetical protein FJ279_10755, partial [Planctomycetes bacterium]|nr:hypothetical protein [Planctomycetota bacterium]